MLKVLRAGIYTTVQDLGRNGFRSLGVSQGGALDAPALKIANLLVGNRADSAGLEITLGQFSAEFTQPGWIALTGAGCDALLDGKPLWTGWRYPVKKGQQLVLHKPRHGMRSYLAIAGGIAVPEVLGSRSTDLRTGFGGLAGRKLQDGDQLPLGRARTCRASRSASSSCCLITASVRCRGRSIRSSAQQHGRRSGVRRGS